MPESNDKQYEQAMNDILAIYAQAEVEMLEKVAKRVAKGITTEGWNEMKLSDVQKLNKELSALMQKVNSKAKKEIEGEVVTEYGKGYYKKAFDKVAVPRNLKELLKATNGLLDNASSKILRNANDVYQKVMANGTTGLLSGVDTRIQATQKMLNEYASKGITSFTDKSGRNWNLSSYAEMCARTVSSHAALQGHIDRQVEVGEDLVKVSTIGTTCPICQRWQGVVLSISGNSPKYHSLDQAKAAGLFHPNCKHTLVMYIPELDDGTEHAGKVEPDVYDNTTYSSQRNKLIEKQRSNERNIRYWKKRKALAITPQEKKKCEKKVKAWQYKNLIHCEKHNLRRQYAREGVMTGHSTGPKGTFIGGTINEYEEVYKNVVGEAPKPLFMKMNLQFFANKKQYDKWLKDEIASLDELDVDKAMMKDASNKSVTPTSLYKKYIGDNPSQDYLAVSEYEKGTKEFKSGYAKWLKQQIDEIGVSYKVKPKYVEIHEDIPIEDTKLSATEIYKKYHDGKKPTDAFKELGGEEATGMKYGKWVETQKKELIKNGITKTVPFDNSATQKTVDTISQANDTIAKAKDTVKKAELDAFKKELDDTVHGQYDGYLAVKKQLEVFKQDMSDTLASEKLDLAKQKHLEMVKKKAEKLYGTSSFMNEELKLVDMALDEKDAIMKAHIQAQAKVYSDVEKEKKEAEEAKKKAVEEAKKKAEEAAVKAKSAQALKSGKVSIGREVSFKEGKLVKSDKIYNELTLSDLENLSSQVKGHELFSAENRRDILGRDRIDGHNHHMGHDVSLKSGLKDEDKKLGEAFKIAYNDYFNTIKCADINMAYLKGYENASLTMQKKIDAMRTCIRSCELNESILLHRYVDEDLIKAIFKTTDLKSIDKHELFENSTFMSTSIGGHPTFGKRPYMITLQCDKGTHALPTINHEELEVLIDKGKLEFIETKTHTKGKPYKLQNFDGSYTNFVGEEVIVRYVEDERTEEYEVVTPEKIDSMLGIKNVSHHTKESKEWIKSLSKDERKASNRYTGSWFTEMNNVYRKGDRDNNEITKLSEDLTTALRRVETTKPVILRRGIWKEDLAHMLGFNGKKSDIDIYWDDINSGDYAAEDKGFLSTSPYKSGGFSKNVELRIYCPKGTHAAYVDSISTHKGEKETLLQSGSMYRVLKLKRENGGIVAYLELLGTD